MESLSLKEISTRDSLSLSSIIDYWKDYDPKSVLLAYAELLGRKFPIPSHLTKKQNEFCAKYNNTDMDTFLNSYLKENGYNTYSEYYEKEIGVAKKEATENILKNTDISTNSSAINDSEPARYAALKTVVGLLSGLGYIVIIVGIILLIFLASDKQVLMGFIAVVVSVIIALPLLVYSNLIYVFIDPERNTRKTLEEITKTNK